jgi:hypothetical protein
MIDQARADGVAPAVIVAAACGLSVRELRAALERQADR